MTTAAPTTTDLSNQPDVLQINALLGKLRLTHDAVDKKQWVSPELSGGQPGSIDAVNSTGSPLSTLDSSGMGFLTPMVSFLNEPLGQLRGDPSSVSSGASEFDSAGQNASAVADEYRSTASNQTSQWSGQSSQDYLSKGLDMADGILSIAETALTSGKALVGAGEVVGKAVADVTQLIGEATGKIVPIMSKAIAEAPATFGQSIAIAIPQCVQIAVDYAGQIAGKMGALLASGENLVKLLDGAAAVVKIVQEGMSFIGKQAQGGSSSSSSPSTSTASTAKPSTSATSSSIQSTSDTSATSDASDAVDTTDSSSSALSTEDNT